MAIQNTQTEHAKTTDNRKTTKTEMGTLTTNQSILGNHYNL